MLDIVREIEKVPKSSKKFLSVVLGVATIFGIGLAAEIVNGVCAEEIITNALLSAIFWPIVALIGAYVGFQANVDKNVRSAMFQPSSITLPTEEPAVPPVSGAAN